MTKGTAANVADRVTNMRRTLELGAEFWNDSCDLKELADAVANGAVGATSNPVIVFNAVSADPERWLPVVDKLVKAHPTDDEDQLAWRLIAELGARAAELLAPVHRNTGGKQGWLCVQVSPKHWRGAERMAAQGKELAKLGPNVAIKVPAVEAGLGAMEELIASGVSVNATVSFTVSQACAVAEAFERGLKRAEKAGLDPEKIRPWVTIMVGRVDDLLKRKLEAGGFSADPASLAWGGVAVFKRAYATFRERGYRARLLAAAYRSELHWSELIGERVVLSMPYKWWNQFNGSATAPAVRIDRAVDPKILEQLRRSEDFRRAEEPAALAPADFERFGASRHTLNEFLEGYQKLLGVIRARMLS